MRNRSIPRLSRLDLNAWADAYRDMPVLNSLCEGGCGRIVQRSSVRGRCLCANCAGELSIRRAVEKQDAELKSRDLKALTANERLERAKEHLAAMAVKRSNKKKSGVLSCSTVDRGHEIGLRKSSNQTPRLNVDHPGRQRGYHGYV
jgi:hypothetical protein